MIFHAVVPHSDTLFEQRFRGAKSRSPTLDFLVTPIMLRRFLSFFQPDPPTSSDSEEQIERAMRELRESEARYRRLFDDPNMAKLLIDLNTGRMINANEPASKLLGIPISSLLGKTNPTLASPWLTRILARLTEEEGEETSFIETFRIGRGELRDYEAWVSLLKISDEPTALITLHDVTERRRLEEEQSRQKERERYIAELEANKAEIETRNAEMERFTYTVSHDLKSPLITIRGFLGMLERDLEAERPDRVRRDVEHITEAVGKMSALLDDLLELSRVGRIVGELHAVELSRVAHEAASLVGGAIDARGVEVEIAEDLPTVHGDQPRLLEVFQNLIENAVRYMGDQEKPRIEIGARHGVEGDPEEKVIFVRDNGVGIESRYHQKIFILFERLETETNGTGVGLALVKRIVEVHGGAIWVESEGKGSGSTFCMTLHDHQVPDGELEPETEEIVL